MLKNDELLLAISDMLDKKINPLERRMDNMEKELKSEMRLVKDEMHVLKDKVHVLKDEMHVLKDEVHVINLKLENIIEPRLNNIESCYLDTYKRYQLGVDKMEKLELDNQIIRSRIQTHDEVLRRNQIA